METSCLKVYSGSLQATFPVLRKIRCKYLITPGGNENDWLYKGGLTISKGENILVDLSQKVEHILRPHQLTLGPNIPQG